jgi:hypothetical protein
MIKIRNDVAMRCNKDQFKEIEPILIKHGFRICVSSWIGKRYLVNNDCGVEKDIETYRKGYFKSCRIVYEAWNASRFLYECGIDVTTTNTSVLNEIL